MALRKTEEGDGVCDTSGCHGKLRTKKDLEDVLGRTGAMKGSD